MAKTKTTKPGLRIRAMKDGFRRAGLKHSLAPKDHLLDALTKKQIDALKAEPLLNVQEVDVPVEEEAGSNQTQG
jgi:hypothetical protein